MNQQIDNEVLVDIQESEQLPQTEPTTPTRDRSVPADAWWSEPVEEEEYTDITPELPAPPINEQPPVASVYDYPPQYAQPYAPIPEQTPYFTAVGAEAQPPVYQPPYQPLQQPISQPNNKISTVALIMGVISLAVCWIPVLGMIPSALALVFGIISKVKGDKGAASLLGIIFGGVALLVAVIVLCSLVMYALSEFFYHMPEIGDEFLYDNGEFLSAFINSRF